MSEPDCWMFLSWLAHNFSRVCVASIASIYGHGPSIQQCCEPVWCRCSLASRHGARPSQDRVVFYGRAREWCLGSLAPTLGGAAAHAPRPAVHWTLPTFADYREPSIDLMETSQLETYINRGHSSQLGSPGSERRIFVTSHPTSPSVGKFLPRSAARPHLSKY